MIDRRPTWFQLYPADAMSIILDMTDEQAGKWCKNFLKYLVAADPECPDAFAGEMIREAISYFDAKRNAGAMGGRARHSAAPGVSAEGTESESEKAMGTGGGDFYNTIFSLPVNQLPDWTAKYCREENTQLAAGGYRKVIRLIGHSAYREALSKFVGSLAAGERCRNRGAVFNKKYLRPAVLAADGMGAK